MTPAERAALVAVVLGDAEALLAVRESRVSALRPWAPVTGRIAVHRGVWRRTAGLVERACVHSWWPGCDGHREPHPSDFHLDEREEFDEAWRKYDERAAIRAGRGWVWSVTIQGARITNYARSRLEAMALADATLIADGVLLAGGAVPLPEDDDPPEGAG